MDISANGFSESLFNKEFETHAKLDQELMREEAWLKDQCRLKWLQCGD